MGLLQVQLLLICLASLFLLALLLRAVLNSTSVVRHKKHRPKDMSEQIEELGETYEPDDPDVLLYSDVARYRAIIANAPIIFSVIDVSGNFIFSEGHGRIQLGIAETDDMSGSSAFEILRNYPLVVADLRRALAGETFTSQHDIGKRIFDVQMAPMRNAQEQIVGAITFAIDVTERALAERALRYQACYDVVTGLPNQNLLRERVMKELQETEGEQMALIIMDLNRFREINDTFGHQHGDLILCEVGHRLSAMLNTAATIARTDGDEFVIFLPNVDEEKTRAALDAICSTFEQPFLIQGFPLYVEASIGAALSYTQQANFFLLFRQADVAMYISKSKRKEYVFYHPDLDPYTPRRLNILGALRTAILQGGLTLFYQPQVNLQTGITHSVEALVRWKHPEYGNIPPDQFIPLAEQTGLIKHLTLRVLEDAIHQCMNWLQKGIQLSVSVNLSAWDLRESDLPDIIAAYLERYGLPARYLCVEVTESAVITEIERAAEILSRICAMGIKVAVDDFGTGYSSLAYLKHLPINELKIDCLFVKEMLSNQIDATIVQSTVAMGRNLGLRVVAEGVEDLETANRLADYGCDIAQGYYWSRPVPASDLERWLEETKAAVVI